MIPAISKNAIRIVEANKRTYKSAPVTFVMKKAMTEAQIFPV